jgi:ribonucleoside-diphosphate reductase alpha chain
LAELKNVAIETNKKWAGLLGINQSTSITCIKPSGTVSQLVDSASGIHTRYSPFYIRRVRGDKRDPLTKFLVDQGVPTEDDVTKPNDMAVFSFPQKAPEGAITRNDMTAIQQLELWKVYQEHWCEHKPSITVYVDEHEWLEVGAWVYKHFDILSGVSFLPKDKHSYKQAPYEEVTKEEYESLVSKMPTSIDWVKLKMYEGATDNTIGSQELACVAGSCDIP